MNLVGKILVVVNLIMSLVFMSLTLAVHATHTNWKKVVDNTQVNERNPLGMKQQLAQKDAELSNLRSQLDEREKALKRAMREYEQRLGQLETSLAEFKKQRDDKQAENETLTAQLKNALDEAAAASTVMKETQRDVEMLRAEIKVKEEQRNASLRKVTSLEDQLAQAAGEWNRLRERKQQLLLDLSRYQLALQDAELQLDRDGPPRLEGLVLAASSNGLVEISLGFDEGLEVGHELDVFRLGSTLATTKYLGRIRIMRIDKDRAVGQEIKDLKQGTILKNDHVATRLSARRAG